MGVVFEDLHLALIESWERWKSLPFRYQRGVLGGIGALIALSIVAWRVALPLGIFAIVVVSYLRGSRSKDEL